MGDYVKNTSETRKQPGQIVKGFKSNKPGTYGPDTVTRSYFGRSDYLYNVLNGSKNPNWKYQILHDVNASTVMHAEQNGLRYFGLRSGYAFAKVRKTVNGGWTENSQEIPYGLAQVGPPGYASMSTLVDTAMNQAITRMVRRIRSVQTAFQGGVYTGEALEAIRMLTGSAKNVISRYEDYVGRLDATFRRMSRARHRGVPGQLDSALRSTIADQWLLLQLGCKPLYGDIQSAAEAVAKANVDYDTRDSVFVRSKGVAKASSLVDLGTGFKDQFFYPGPPVIKVDYCLRDDYEAVVYLWGKAQAIRTGATGVDQWLGIGPQDWLPTLWELIPYSWLADYFTNIGDVVSGASLFDSGVAWLWQTVVTQRTRRFDRSALDTNYFMTQNPVSSGYFNHETRFVPPTVEAYYKSVDRQSHGKDLTPRLSFELPGVQGWKKWLNIAALTRNSAVALRSLNNARFPTRRRGPVRNYL